MGIVLNMVPLEFWEDQVRPSSETHCSEMLTPNAFTHFSRHFLSTHYVPGSSCHGKMRSGNQWLRPSSSSSELPLMGSAGTCHRKPSLRWPQIHEMDQHLAPHHHVRSEKGPAATDLASGVRGWPRVLFTEHTAPLPEGTSLSFRREREPNMDLSPPPGSPLVGLVAAPGIPLSYWDHTVNSEQSEAPMGTTRILPLTAWVLL